MNVANVTGMFLVGYYATKRTFSIRTYLRSHKSFTPSVLKLITSLSFAKLVTLMNVTLLSGLCIRIVIDYSSTSVQFIYLRMLAGIHVRIVCIVITCAYHCDSIKKLDDDERS